MTPKFIISLDRAPDYEPHYVAEDGAIASGHAYDNFDKSRKFDDGREAEIFAEKLYPEWHCCLNYCGVGFQEEFAKREAAR
jgi:hypothetical protein